MYDTDDTYSCDFCGFTEKWDETDDVHGDMWSCEKCGTIICSKCMIEAIGEREYLSMMQEGDCVLCPDCVKKEIGYER